MSGADNTWAAASRAYNRHHFTCAQCIATGVNPAGNSRCAEGTALWSAYKEAGAPSHFLWLRKNPEGAAS